MAYNEKLPVTVFYEKYYIDSTSRHIPALFEKNEIQNISIKRYWNAVEDGYYSYKTATVYLTCITGDVRIIIARQDNTGSYKKIEYYISELDGKVIKIKPNTLFCMINISNINSCILIGTSEIESGAIPIHI